MKRGRFSLGLKDSYFVGEGEVEEEAALAPVRDLEQPDLDDKLLDVMEADSDDGGDWRNAAAVGSDEDDAEGGKMARSTHSAPEPAHCVRPQTLGMPCQSPSAAIVGYSCQLPDSSPCCRLVYRPDEHPRICLKRALNSFDPSFTIWMDYSA